MYCLFAKCRYYSRTFLSAILPRPVSEEVDVDVNSSRVEHPRDFISIRDYTCVL